MDQQTTPGENSWMSAFERTLDNTEVVGPYGIARMPISTFEIVTVAAYLAWVLIHALVR